MSTLFSDICDDRLAIASKMGADAVLNVKGKAPKDLAIKISELLGKEADITIDCSGFEASIQLAIFVRVILFSLKKGERIASHRIAAHTVSFVLFFIRHLGLGIYHSS